MPILTIPESDAPLTQGDVLKGLRLFATGPDWSDAGGSPEKLSKAHLCLVISRPCVALHKPVVVVAAVESQMGGVPKDVDTFPKIREFLEQLRDGLGRPDCFYLGRVPGQPEGRYYAKLDSLHTVGVPDLKEDEGLLERFRVATLTDDFRRDLQIRIFSAVARLGFDDAGWYSDEDLRWLIGAGEVEETACERELTEAHAQLSRIQASGSQHSSRVETLQKRIAAAKKKREDIHRQVAPYREEASRRDSADRQS